MAILSIGNFGANFWIILFKIALVESALEIKNTEIDAKIQITDPGKLQAFIEQEEKFKEWISILNKAIVSTITKELLDQKIGFLNVVTCSMSSSAS